MSKLEFNKTWEKISQQIEKIRSHAWVKVIEGDQKCPTQILVLNTLRSGLT